MKVERCEHVRGDVPAQRGVIAVAAIVTRIAVPVRVRCSVVGTHFHLGCRLGLAGIEGVALAELSLNSFLATIASGVIAGLLFVLGHDAHGGPDLGLVLGAAAVMLLFAALVNSISLFCGTVAWVGRGRECPWVFLNGILFLLTIFAALQQFRVGY